MASLYTICNLVNRLRAEGNRSIYVGALTGVAAVVLSESGVKARTLHSLLGIRLGQEDADTLAKLIMGDARKLYRWRNMSLLVVDEISMLGGVLFDKLDTVGRIVRGIDAPFWRNTILI